MSVMGENSGLDLYVDLCSLISKKVPGFSIRFKKGNFWQRFIGFFVFFNKEYMTRYTSTFGRTVWFPSQEYVRANPWRAFKILSHEYVHLLDRKKHGLLFNVIYGFPQNLVVFSFLSVLSVWFSNWWLLSLFFVFSLAPWPAVGRAYCEMRGYAMNIAVNYWKHGSFSESTDEWIMKQFRGWNYYRMWPYDKVLGDWIATAKIAVLSIDAVGEGAKHPIFLESESYADVYQLMTDIDLIDR